jgi:DNA-binding CsgD family transcriptional regulator
MTQRLSFFIFIFIFSHLAFSQGAQALFKKVDEYQFTNAPKAFEYLQQIEKQYPQLPDSLKGKYHNHLGIYYAIQGKNDQALKAFRTILNIAPSGSVSKAGAYSNIANVYKALGKYDQANKVLEYALKIYKDLEEDDLYYSVLGEMAANDYYALNWGRSMHRTLTVIQHLENSKNQRFLHIQKQRLANLYFSLGWHQKALPLYRSCEAYYKGKPDDILNLAYVSINLGDAYAQTNQANKSIARYENAIQILAKTDQHNYLLAKSKLTAALIKTKQIEKAKRYGATVFAEQVKQKSITCYNTATSLIKIYDKPLALKFFLLRIKQLEKVIAVSGLHPTDALAYERALIDGYHQLKDFQNENQHWRRAVKYRDIINQEKLISNTEKVVTQEKVKNARLKANDLQLKLKIANIERWLGLLISMLATSIAGLIYFISKRKRKVQQTQFNDLKEENEEHKTLLATERRNLELEQEIASMKERELTALSLQFYELQESIIEDLKQLEKLEHTPEINRLRKKWARQVKEKNYWQEFELKFTALHPDFLQKLQKAHPQLTKKDADFCALVRLNLSNKEIASLTQISYESVISKKYKLRKKLGYKTDQDFLEFLHSIAS